MARRLHLSNGVQCQSVQLDYAFGGRQRNIASASPQNDYIPVDVALNLKGFNPFNQVGCWGREMYAGHGLAVPPREGASVALRKLVEEAKRRTATREDRRRAQERDY